MGNVIAVESKEDFDTLLSTNDVVVVKFWATWCGPCKQLKPVFEAVAESSDALFVEVDVDNSPWAMVDYGIRGVPTVLLINADGVHTITERRAIPMLNKIRELGG